MYQLIDTLIESMGEAYPELPAQRDLIIKVIKEEEDAFLRTLDKGISLLDVVMADTRRAGKTEISGKDAFTLYDTYGFPLDLTELILKENGMTLDHEGFKKEMDSQKARARNAAAVEATDWVVLREGEPSFVGYDCSEVDTEVLRWRHVKQKNKEFYQIVLAQSPFYAEMGGQVGDRGTLTMADGSVIEIYDTKRENGMAVHLAAKIPADLSGTVHAAIDTAHRAAVSANHTATHLLHEALREVLGTHVEQKGSYVSADLLRFDFSHFQKLTPDELRRVEHLANAKVRQALARDEHRNVPIAEARNMGAMALFGEKYGDEVRVIRYGSSCELCGGTHVDNTGNIGMIHIISESSIAAGIRRIEAITGEKVEDAFDAVNDTLQQVRALFNNAPDVIAALRKSIEENDRLRHEAQEAMTERINSLSREMVANAEEIDGLRIIALQGVRVPDLVKNLAFAVRRDSPESTVFIGATKDISDKPLLTVMITDDLVSARGLNAGAIVRAAAREIQGGGGGQAGFAQAGGKNAEGLDKAFAAMRAAVLGKQ